MRIVMDHFSDTCCCVTGKRNSFLQSCIVRAKFADFIVAFGKRSFQNLLRDRYSWFRVRSTQVTIFDYPKQSYWMSDFRTEMFWHVKMRELRSGPNKRMLVGGNMNVNGNEMWEGMCPRGPTRLVINAQRVAGSKPSGCGNRLHVTTTSKEAPCPKPIAMTWKSLVCCKQSPELKIAVLALVCKNARFSVNCRHPKKMHFVRFASAMWGGVMFGCALNISLICISRECEFLMLFWCHRFPSDMIILIFISFKKNM